MNRWSVLIRGGRVVDPVNHRDATLDVALDGPTVAEVGEGLDPGRADTTVDAAGRVVIPGLVDPHVHLTAWIGCEAGHVMLARAGVSTAIDVAGPIHELRASLGHHGAGLNVGCLHMAAPERLGLPREPSAGQLRAYAEQALRDGALGVKVLGGHFPFSPEATARVIAAANDAGAFVMVHVGTTNLPGSIAGLRELVELGGDYAYHVAHVNSYCRGRNVPAAEEAREALGLLASRPRVASDSYLDPHNGVPGVFDDTGQMESAVTRFWLQSGGYPPTREGALAALKAGWAFAVLKRGRENFFVTGEEAAVGYAEAAHPPALSFIANDAAAQRLLAISRDERGAFVVPVLGTDGGGLPRNTTLKHGLGLVANGDLSLGDLVWKASAAPARLFGLGGKGSLAPGADADVCIVDLPSRAATDLFVGGRPVLRAGQVVGSGGTLLVREAALAAGHADGVAMRAVGN